MVCQLYLNLGEKKKSINPMNPMMLALKVKIPNLSQRGVKPL